ncbi:MAG: PDZ domain-containing protein [Ruminococcaceae bacterium]|nr:PDZ domain-containing protein [Oscillospiraceae bacterium]
MYNDENNYYHYSYKKPESGQNASGQQPAPADEQLNRYRNMYQNTAQSSQPQYSAPQPQGYYQSSQPPQPPVQPPKAKKSRTGVKIVALALVCALLGGAAGAGIMASVKGGQDKNTATVQVSDRPVEEVVLQPVDGQKLLTDAENYAANVNRAVSINCSATTNYFGQTVENASSGSGFILTADGYIVTNHHVIEGATTVKVTLYSGETYDATIIGSDEDYDIGVIKVDVTNLLPVVIGDSEKLNVGDRVLAIGNPLGELTFSQTGGMVSSVNRAINVDGTPFNMIQTDTSINPGNSGGPLFNSYGEVVGIVTAKYSTYSNSVVEGLGFAIPINDVMAMIEDIMTNGYVTNKPYLGVSAGTLTEQMAAQYRYDISNGVFIYSVEEGGAAAKAGLQMGDVIRKVDDHIITSLEDLTAVKKNYSAGDTVTLTVYRGGNELTMELTWDVQPVEEAPGQDQSGQGNQGGNYPGNNPGNYPGNYPGSIFDFFEDFFNQYGGFGGGYYGR